MDSGIISTRYARAIYEYAVEKGEEKQVYNDMNRLVANFEACPTMGEVMNNPTLSLDDKTCILTTACGKEMVDTTRKIIRLISDNKRSDYMESIARSYGEVYRKEKGIKHVWLTTSEAASDKTQKELEEIVKQHVQCQCVEIHNRIDPDIIGGFILEIDDQRLNASVKNQLMQMKLDLME